MKENYERLDTATLTPNQDLLRFWAIRLGIEPRPRVSSAMLCQLSCGGRCHKPMGLKLETSRHSRFFFIRIIDLTGRWVSRLAGKQVYRQAEERTDWYTIMSYSTSWCIPFNIFYIPIIERWLAFLHVVIVVMETQQELRSTFTKRLEIIALREGSKIIASLPLNMHKFLISPLPNTFVFAWYCSAQLVPESKDGIREPGWYQGKWVFCYSVGGESIYQIIANSRCCWMMLRKLSFVDSVYIHNAHCHC